MKSVNPLFTTLLLAVLILLGSCSSNVEHPVVTEDSEVTRDKALIVMGAAFLEKYNDTVEEETKILFSADLLKDKKLLKKRLDEINGTALDLPLHYLSRFRFQFMTPGEAVNEIVRLNKDIKEYEAIAIHEFVPGSVRLFKILTEQHYFKDRIYNRARVTPWQKHWVNYEESFGSWELQEGKVTYIGHLTMYFVTKRFSRGLLMPVELVEKTEVVAIVIEDRFEEVKEQLKNEKPWFPVAEMENQSRPGEWIYDQKAFDEFNEEEAEPGVEKNKVKKKKRDSKKFFF